MSSAERSPLLGNPYAQGDADVRRGRSVRGAGRALATAAVGLGAFAALAGTASAEAPAGAASAEAAPTVEMVEQWRLTDPAAYGEWLAESGMTTEEQQASYQRWRQSQDHIEVRDALMRLWSDANGLTGFDAQRTDIPPYPDVFHALDALSVEELQEVRTVQDILAVVDASDVEDVQVTPSPQDPEYVSPGIREALDSKAARDSQDVSSEDDTPLHGASPMDTPVGWAPTGEPVPVDLTIPYPAVPEQNTSPIQDSASLDAASPMDIPAGWAPNGKPIPVTHGLGPGEPSWGAGGEPLDVLVGSAAPVVETAVLDELLNIAGNEPVIEVSAWANMTALAPSPALEPSASSADSSGSTNSSLGGGF